MLTGKVSIEELQLTSEHEHEILILIRDIRQVFEDHFDRTWMAMVIDGLPFDFRTIREIRELVSITAFHPGDERAIQAGVTELESFILHVRRYLLPVIKERLGVSWLLPHRRVQDKTQYLLRRLVVYAFPYNLEKLTFLTARLKSRLYFLYPEL